MAGPGRAGLNLPAGWEGGTRGMSGPGLTSLCPDCASPSPLTPRSTHRTCPRGQAFKHMDRHREADRGVNTCVAPTHRETQVLSPPNTVAGAHGTQTHNRHTPDRTHHTHCPDTWKLRAHAHNHTQTQTHTQQSQRAHTRTLKHTEIYPEYTKNTHTPKHTYMWTQ